MTEPSDAVADYVARVPEDRRAAFDAVLQVVRENLPPGYEETVNWGMVCWQVPLETYPDTYNRQPLMFCGLATSCRWRTSARSSPRRTWPASWRRRRPRGAEARYARGSRRR